jgi:MerR family redox-sensitive transcriptional activator SoxR
MTIGQLSRRAGLRPSAVRYYERMGVVPTPPRRSGRRDYGPDALANLAVVQFARECGFTLADTKQLIRGFSPTTTASARWRGLADTKLRELDALAAKVAAMQELLRKVTRCECGTLTQCGRGLLRRYGTKGEPDEPRTDRPRSPGPRTRG